MTGSPIKHWANYSLTEEQIKRYLEMPLEKRLEWLYLGNLLRKIFCDEMIKCKMILKRSKDKARGLWISHIL